MNQELPEFAVSDFVAVFNQTISYAYPAVVIIGEVSEIRISRGRWVYFNLKDENSSVKFFGSTLTISSPIEEGMILKVRGVPNLHNKYGFSVQVQSIQLVGKGSIKRSANILQQKLEKEGLFASERKRTLPYSPNRIGLIASKESAAYSDFLKVIDARWSGLIVHHYDVQVQGEQAPDQIIAGINYINSMQLPVQAIIITRGGGGADDLQIFNVENLVRSIAVSRIPTMVAIGHERDVSLAEMVADVRASTPSNAAELLVPNKKTEMLRVEQDEQQLIRFFKDVVIDSKLELGVNLKEINKQFVNIVSKEAQLLAIKSELLNGHNPKLILKKGYSLVRSKGSLLRLTSQVKRGDNLDIELGDGTITAQAK